MNSTYIFRASGILIYDEQSNPYETVEIYMDYEPGRLAVKSHISEHGPDGGSSWRGVFIEDIELRKLKYVVGEDIKVFLSQYLRKNASRGLIGLSEFLKGNDIAFESLYAF